MMIQGYFRCILRHGFASIFFIQGWVCWNCLGLWTGCPDCPIGKIVGNYRKNIYIYISMEVLKVHRYLCISILSMVNVWYIYMSFSIHIYIYISTGWWFQTCFIFICFKMVQTNHQPVFSWENQLSPVFGCFSKLESPATRGIHREYIGFVFLEPLTHRIHVCYIWKHLPSIYPKC